MSLGVKHELIQVQRLRWCEEEVENLTDEHVFPAFSGANLVVPNGSCKPCNNICSKFEQKIAGEVETTRHIFEIQDRYGEIPKLPVAIEVQGEGAKPGRGAWTPDTRRRY